MKVKEVFSDNFEEIYPLLTEFNNSKIKKEQWRKLFDIPFKTPCEHRGFMLEDDGKIVGYWGLIFSTQVIEGIDQKFCNMSSGIIQKKYRTQGLLLLMKIFKLKGYTITNLSANGDVAGILKKFKFQVAETGYNIVIPMPTFSKKDVDIVFDKEEILNTLTPADAKRYTEHISYNVKQFVLKTGTEHCLATISYEKKKNLKVARIHYLSNSELFCYSINKIGFKLCRQLKCAGFIIENRFISSKLKGLTFAKEYGQPRFFKSEAITDPKQINDLYSELILLHN